MTDEQIWHIVREQKIKPNDDLVEYTTADGVGWGFITELEGHVAIVDENDDIVYRSKDVFSIVKK